MDAWLANLTSVGWRQCWQVTLLIAAVWFSLRVVGRNRPHLACSLWLLVLIKCLTPPIWSSPSGVFCWLQSSEKSSLQTPAATSTNVRDLPLAVVQASDPNDDEADAVSVQVKRRSSRDHTLSDLPLPAEHGSTTPQRGWPMSSLLWLTLAIWLAGCVASLFITSIRIWRCWRSLNMAGSIANPQLEQLLQELRPVIGLRRQVRLWITESRVGPAVIGLWRPVVILPALLTQRKTAEELAPLLAHELVHVRRGDLWIGVLQLLAQTVWWFHPLVRLACRWLTREAERCCDEAVIAHLACTPAAYARGLLDVVALKQQLQPLPSFPGVRPVDVTRGRLERIMNLRHGCRTRTPWWCWAVLAAAAAVILPGAAMVLSSREKSSNQFLTKSPADLVNYQRIAVNQFEVDDLGGDQSLVTETYDVEDLFMRLIEERQETAASAREHLATIVQSSAPGPWEIGSGITLAADQTKRSLGWKDVGLVVRQTAAGQERIERQLAALRKHGFSELTVEVRILSGRIPAIDQIASKWQLIGATADEDWGTETQTLVEGGRRTTNNKDEFGPIRGTVESVVEKQVPVTIGFLSFDETRSVVQATQQSPTTKIVQAPKVSVFNGQSARIADTVQRHFVVGVKPTPDGGQQPQVRVVSEGTTIRLRPKLTSNDAVQLDLSLILSRVRGVETAEFRTVRDSEPVTVQVPEVGMTKLKTTVDMQLNQTLAINLPSAVTGAEFKAGCVLVSIFRSPDNSLRAGGPRTIEYPVARAAHAQLVAVPPFKRAEDGELIEKVYMVADLVIPIPFEPMVVPLPYSHSIGAPPAPLKPDFDSLIELLTTTISPRSWSTAGGPGKITITPNRLSLFISTTEDIHSQIGDTFEQLRRHQDLQICWSVAVVEVKQGEVEQWARDKKGAPTQLAGSQMPKVTFTPQEMQSFQKGVSCKYLSHEMKVTGFNGQAPDLRFQSLQESTPTLIGRALMQASITADFRFIRLMVAVDDKIPDPLSKTEPVWNQTFNLPRGHSFLIDLDSQRWKMASGSSSMVAGSDGSKQSARAAAESPTVRQLVLLTPTVLMASNQAYYRGLAPLDEN